MPATAKFGALPPPETRDPAIPGGGSHIGFVFFPPSPRHLSFEKAQGLAARVPEQVARVGVFVDPDDGMLDAAIAAGRLNVIQLHKVTPERAAAVRARTSRETWVALAVKTRADLVPAAGFRGAADCLLYDAKAPEGAKVPGGTGLRFDWGLLDGFAHPLPWILSGGLDAGNVGEAVRVTGARLVDVSSGIETAPGIKDVDKIAAFLKAVGRS